MFKQLQDRMNVTIAFWTPHIQPLTFCNIPIPSAPLRNPVAGDDPLALPNGNLPVQGQDHGKLPHVSLTYFIFL